MRIFLSPLFTIFFPSIFDLSSAFSVGPAPFSVQPRLVVSHRYTNQFIRGNFLARKSSYAVLEHRWMTRGGKEDQTLQNKDSPITELSTSELLAELDQRNIRYNPSATRQELEQLLLIGRSGATVQGTNTAGFADTTNKNLALIVQELLKRGVRLPPNASRAELERLLQEQVLNSKQSAATAEKRTESKSRTQKAIPRLLKELDDLGIPHPAGASPKMLERLLREYDQDSMEIPSPMSPSRQPRRPPVGQSSQREATNRGRRINDSRRPPTTNSNNNNKKSTADLLSELGRRGIRFPPTATRADLEELLRVHRETPSAPEDNTDPVETRNNLQYEEGVEPGTHERTADAKKKPEPTFDGETQVRTADAKKNPKPTFDAETYQRTASSKKDLKPNFDDATSSQQRKTGAENFQNARRAQNIEQDPQSTPRTKRMINSNRSVWSKIPNYVAKTTGSATTRLSQAAERAARKARYTARSARDFFAEDEDGIRDADYFYVKKDILIDVAAEPVIGDGTSQRYTDANKRRRTPKVAKPQYSNWEPSFPAQPRGRRRRRPSGVPNPASTTFSADGFDRVRHGASNGEPFTSATSPAYGSSLFRLPPAKSTDSPEKGFSRAKPSTRATRNPSRSQRDQNRRVYSPYEEEGLASQVYRDAIDRFGDIVGNVTESILWGRVDNEYDEPDVAIPDPSAPEPKRKGRTSARNKNDSYRDRTTSWKDRLEERLDSMLGVHEGGEYYNRWAGQEDIEKEGEGGNDAFSVAQGRAPKSKRHGKRKRNYDRPFWEQENLIGALFGKLPPPGLDLFGGVGLLPFFKTLVKSSVLMATNACEWASVRGSLPQPVVVVGVTSCVLSARPGKRLLAMAVSLIAFRIFGELIHEGLYADEDWEDFDDDDDASSESSR